MVQPNHKGAWERDSRWNDWWASLSATLQISGDKCRSSCQRTASPLCCRSVLLQRFPCWNHLLVFFFCTRHFFFFPIKHCLMFKNIETCSVSTIWSQNQHAPNSPITQLHPATTPAETDPFLSICPSCHWSWPWEVTSVTAPSSCDVASWQHPTRAICPETSSFSWLPSTP